MTRIVVRCSRWWYNGLAPGPVRLRLTPAYARAAGAPGQARIMMTDGMVWGMGCWHVLGVALLVPVRQRAAADADRRRTLLGRLHGLAIGLPLAAQSIFAPASLATLVHLSISAPTKACISSGFMPPGTKPCASIFSLMAGSLIACTAAA
jgi:hypothetical protein